jgi:hypothetical protein
MPENALQEVGWREAEASVDVRLQHNNLSIGRGWHCCTRINLPSGNLLGFYLSFLLQ